MAEQLAVADRLALAKRLWESVVGDAVGADEEDRLVDQAYEAYLANPNAGVSWEEFERQLDAEAGKTS